MAHLKGVVRKEEASFQYKNSFDKYILTRGEIFLFLSCIH